MRTRICVWSTLIVVLSGAGAFTWQGQDKKPPTVANLALTAEVAATTEDGYPVALRVTVKNVGNLVVTMPLLASDCHPENGLRLESGWINLDGKSGIGGGVGCGMFDRPTLLERVRSKWIRLAPGEFMTTMLRFEVPSRQPGNIVYWVEYTPPDATPREIEDLLRAGYVIPTEKLTTEQQEFVIH